MLFNLLGNRDEDVKADQKEDMIDVSLLDQIKTITIDEVMVALKAALNGLSKDDWSTFRDEGLFNEFDREFVTKLAYSLLGVKAIIFSATLIAIRGPKVAEKLRMSFLNGKSLFSLGIIQKARPRVTELTPSRLLACFPDFASYGMMVIRVPKRIPENPLPAWLQFPAAAGLTMSLDYRQHHKKFCRDFAELIKNKATGQSMPFREDIYTVQEGKAFANRLRDEMYLAMFKMNIDTVGNRHIWTKNREADIEFLKASGVHFELPDIPLKDAGGEEKGLQ
jgi:hypothetical protein